ncbi:glycosyltransferase family 25 protein [Bradyrhizobium liaoningense]|uniref:glycosyltransferase family 25 protein n=1 Tax=Bradyrhizobium liaoningense TaxID=43992 RepID=UPI001BAAECDC|nr:glycosyltransferase family 25 protein [Bradyrhizobium liaoningense]MBR1170996.1 glycosyltransferase family 25 protein [Bradyrhizobium liaoningense]
MNSDLNVIVISFPDSPRRERASANLDALGLPWRYFDALREPPAHLPQYNEEASVRLWGRGLSRSEIGCAASHIAVLEILARSSEETWTLVIEDDVALDTGFPYRALVELCRVAQIGYLRLYARHLPNLRNVLWLGQRELIRFERAPMGTQAYLINTSKARSFIRSVRTIDRPIDWEMDRFWHNGLVNYALFPFPCIELTTGSSIKKQAEWTKIPSAIDRAIWVAWKSKEAIRRLMANLRLRWQDRTIRAAFEQQRFEF